MAPIYALAGLVAIVASSFVHAAGHCNRLPRGDYVAAPTRRQLGNLQCNIDRAEIVFHVAQLATLASTIGNATNLMSANSTVDADVQAMEMGVQGAGGAIKQILLALINGDAAPPDFRTDVEGNLTMIHNALSDLSSDDATTSALLGMASTELNSAGIAGDAVLNDCN